MKRLALIFCLLVTPLFAVEPDEVLDDPVLEERARVISADVRCVVCQNEPRFGWGHSSFWRWAFWPWSSPCAASADKERRR